jgi:N4-gp56 family major capsid protein
MATLDIATGAAQAVKIWSTLLLQRALYKTYYGRFASTKMDAPFQILTDLTKGPGDQIKYDVVAQEGGYGVNGNTTLEGSETTLTFYQNTLTINQKRLAHAWYRMSQQRTVHQLRKTSLEVLSDAWARIMDEYLFAFLCGTAGANATLDADITNHAAQALVAVEAASLIDNTGSAMTVDMLDDMRWKAEARAQADGGPVQKIKVNGFEGYLVFIHPYQAAQLQNDSEWRSAQENADVRGDQNKLFTGAMGSWNGMVIHVSNYLPFQAANVANAVLCGKQAAVVGFGNAFDTLDQERYGKEFVFSWQERSQTDYNNIKGVAASAIFGVNRNIFNSDSHGVILLKTTSAAPA